MVLPIKGEMNSVLRKKVFIYILFFIYIGILLRITVFRRGFNFQNLCQNGSVNLTIFQSYAPLLRNRDFKRIIYLFVGNIIWFVPFGFYLRHFGRVQWKAWQIWLFGLSFSFIIELLQYVFGTGISELDDLILNSLGTWIGAILGKRRQG